MEEVGRFAASSELRVTGRNGASIRGAAEWNSNILHSIVHGIALAKTWRPVDLHSAAADLPLEYLGVPITYLSLNDFLNLAVQLRTVPELLASA
jgi:hypothetical protein